MLGFAAESAALLASQVFFSSQAFSAELALSPPQDFFFVSQDFFASEHAFFSEQHEPDVEQQLFAASS